MDPVLPRPLAPGDPSPAQLPHGLSLLWETADEHAALSERFSFQGLADVSGWLADVLRVRWGLRLRTCDRVVISDHNAIAWVSSDRGGLVVKWSRTSTMFPRLAASTELLAALAAHEVPVAAPLPAKDGAVRVVVDGPAGPLSAAVLPEIAGTWLDVRDVEAVRTVGAELARLHEVLSGLPAPALEQSPPRPPRLRVLDWLERHDHHRAPTASSRLATLIQELPELEDAPQLVHGDVRAANLLMRDGEVAAVLDLDEIRTDHRVAELAQTNVLLGTLFRDWRPTPAPARAALREGYERIRPLGEVETRWLDALTLWIGIASIPAGEQAGPWIAAVEDPSAD